MVLHTIISEEDIFRTGLYGNDMPQSRTKRIKGGFVEMRKSDGGYKVGRVFSTDPSVYLKNWNY